MTSRFASVPGPDGGPGVPLDDTTPVVAGVVIETAAGRAPHVAIRLGEVDGLEIVGGDGDRRLAAVWSAVSARKLERLVEELVRREEQILGIFPTFIGRDDEGEGDDRRKARDGALGQMDAGGNPAADS